MSIPAFPAGVLAAPLTAVPAGPLMEAARQMGADGQGWLVVVPDGVTVVEPVQLSPVARMGQQSLFLWLGVGSSLVLSEHISGGGETVQRVEIHVGERADLRYSSLQDVDADATYTNRTVVRVAAGGRSSLRLITLGARAVDHDVRTELTGVDAVGSLEWAFYARGAEEYRLMERAVFQAARGGGETVMRGVAEEKARVQCHGMIDIGQSGGGTDTYLTQQVLMLDPTAKADAVPGLEIKTNDVKASHSASIANVSAEDLFYLSARGIPRDTTRRMFVRGYVEDIAERVEDEALRQAILEAVERKMAL